jgi:hypothetical protein
MNLPTQAIVILFALGMPCGVAVGGPSEIAYLEAVEPEGQTCLWVLSSKDGQKLADYSLSASPVFDPFAVVDGCLLLTTVDGHVTCFRSAASGLKQ